MDDPYFSCCTGRTIGRLRPVQEALRGLAGTDTRLRVVPGCRPHAHAGLGLGESHLPGETHQPHFLLTETDARAPHQVDQYQGEEVQEQVGPPRHPHAVGRPLGHGGEYDREHAAYDGQAGQDLATRLTPQRRPGAQRQPHREDERGDQEELDDHRRPPWLTRWAIVSARMLTLLSSGWPLARE